MCTGAKMHVRNVFTFILGRHICIECIVNLRPQCSYTSLNIIPVDVVPWVYQDISRSFEWRRNTIDMSTTISDREIR